jgi:hypothetical protein
MGFGLMSSWEVLLKESSHVSGSPKWHLWPLKLHACKVG